MAVLSIQVYKSKPWHPDVKAWVLDRRMQKAGVTRLYGSLLWDVEAQDRRIGSVMIATEAGNMRLRAGNWIDATGDGDLCVRAGADHFGGREHDGRTHAFTQSARLIMPDSDGVPRMVTNNFDSGWVLPEDPADWTRARCIGLQPYIDQHSQYAMRMMRDIQRLGEVCGLAAALCRDGDANYAVDRAALRTGLEASGALERHNGRRHYAVFGFQQFGDVAKHLGSFDRQAAITKARTKLAAGKAHPGMRWMLQEMDQHRDFCYEQLSSQDLEVVYLAASLLAVTGDSAAGERLLQLWRERIPGGGGHPHWYRALVLLRCCGTAAHLQHLTQCLPPEPVLHDVAVALLLTAARIRERHPDAQAPALAVLAWAQRAQIVGSRRPPLYGAPDLLNRWQAGEKFPDHIHTTIRRAKHVAAAFHVIDDSSWQIRLCRARLALACDSDTEEDLRILHDDERGYVRQAGVRLLKQAMT